MNKLIEEIEFLNSKSYEQLNKMLKFNEKFRLLIFILLLLSIPPLIYYGITLKPIAMSIPTVVMLICVYILRNTETRIQNIATIMLRKL